MRALVVAVVGLACASKPEIRSHPSVMVTIVEPGTSPRRQVRYTFVPGYVEDVELELKTDAVMSVTDTTLTSNSHREESPSIRVIRSFRVTGATTDGADVAVTVKDVTVDPGPVSARLRGELDKLRTAKGSWRVSPTGLRSSRTGDQWGIETPAIVFPDDEIGIGARWNVITRERVGGAMWDQVVTFRLRDLTPTTASVDLEVIRLAGEQGLHVEPSKTITLTSGSSRTTATMNVSLRGFAETGSGHERSQLDVAIVQKALRITSRTDITLYYGAKPVTR